MSKKNELTPLIVKKIEKQFGKNVTAGNIFSIMTIAMSVIEKSGKKGGLTGVEKKDMVLDVVKTIVNTYALPLERDEIIGYVDLFGGMGIDMVIWLSRNPKVIKTLNANGCGGVLGCCQ